MERQDGRYLHKITVPLSKPIIVYTILTSFMGPWVDFIFGKGYLPCRCTVLYGVYWSLEDA